MTLERWQQQYFIFSQRSVGRLVKAVDFSNLCSIICQRWHSKTAKRTSGLHAQDVL